jgi:hypothetical protein
MDSIFLEFTGLFMMFGRKLNPGPGLVLAEKKLPKSRVGLQWAACS